MPEMATVLVVDTEIPSFVEHAVHDLHFFVHYDVASSDGIVDTLQLHCGRSTVNTSTLYGPQCAPSFADETGARRKQMFF